MPHLEPSYLRYIYDGLEKGELHPDNAAALPEGLTGLYEAAFEESKPARVRQKLLEIFAVWALLKKEVSTQFVAELLEVPTQEIIDFIATYSSWFTSPESGKYQLYHERLKVYLLQKLSEQEIAVLHDKLAIRLEHAILEQKQDEFELYGLEFLSLHYFTTAIITGDGKKLIGLSYDQNHWERQLKLSKGFEWTKKGLKHVITWASKFNDEEVIECGLQMVDLHHQEQNDAPQIVAIVADGDIEVALKRIEAFGGNDKEGLQRKFNLYMLCLMELTLLESKDKPFRKDAIEKILKHFDENIPVDHSVLNWDDFFPSYLMFQMACEFAKLGLDYKILYERTKTWDSDWIKENVSFSDYQFEVLLECALIINYEGKVLDAISTQLAKQGKIEDSLTYIYKKNDEYGKNDLLRDISSELARQLQFKDAIELTKIISDESIKSNALDNISTELAKQGLIEKAFLVIQKINKNYHREKALENLSLELAKQGRHEEALQYTLIINTESYKLESLANISTELYKQGKFENAEKVIQQALDCANNYSNESFKSYALTVCFIELGKQGKIEYIMKNLFKIDSNYLKYEVLISIFIELSKYGNKLEASFFLDQAKTTINTIDNQKEYVESLRNITLILIDLNRIEEALCFFNNISDYRRKNITLRKICIELAEKGNFEKAIELNNFFNVGSIWSGGTENNPNILSGIIEEMSIQGRYVAAFELAQNISNNFVKGKAIKKIINDLVWKEKKNEAYSIMKNNLIYKTPIKQDNKICEIAKEMIIQTEGKISLSTALFIKGEKLKNNTISDIAIEIAKKGNLALAFECIDFISFNWKKSTTFWTICLDLSDVIKNKISKIKIHEELDSLYTIENDFIKIPLLLKIYKNLNNLGIKTKSNQIIEKIIELSCQLKNGSDKIELLEEITVEFINIGFINEALKIARLIEDHTSKHRDIKSLMLISGALYKKDESEIGLEIRNEAIEKVYTLEYKNFGLNIISYELAKQGCFKEALNIKYFNEKCVKNQDTALLDILILYIENRKLEKALECLSKINDSDLRDDAFQKISIELAKQGYVKNAIEHALSINDERYKDYSLKNISLELIRQGNINEAIYCAENIIGRSLRGISYLYITNELVKNENVGELEAIIEKVRDCFFQNKYKDYEMEGLFIELIINLLNKSNFQLVEKINVIFSNYERNLMWNKIGKSMILKVGPKKSFEFINRLKNKDVKAKYLIGWNEGSHITNISIDSAKKAINYLTEDIEQIEKVLQNFALNQLFFLKSSEEKIQRFNRSLNIQWAIDIKNQLPN